MLDLFWSRRVVHIVMWLHVDALRQKDTSSVTKMYYLGEILIMGDACIGIGDIWQISLLPSQFCWEPKTTLKYKSLLEKK